MTNQTITPCPYDGIIPNHSQSMVEARCCDSSMGVHFMSEWHKHCDNALSGALRASGITTIAQLNARMAPDPRVAVLENICKNAIWALGEHSDEGSKRRYYELQNELIAAQRGEGG